MKLVHYTRVENIESILRDGVLLTTESILQKGRSIHSMCEENRCICDDRHYFMSQNESPPYLKGRSVYFKLCSKPEVYAGWVSIIHDVELLKERTDWHAAYWYCTEPLFSNYDDLKKTNFLFDKEEEDHEVIFYNDVKILNAEFSYTKSDDAYLKSVLNKLKLNHTTRYVN